MEEATGNGVNDRSIMKVAENIGIYEREGLWEAVGRGDEWSAPWGSVEMQWHGSILPRIAGSVPAGTILEIACGYGRWTNYLRKLCDRLIAIDITPACVEHCRERFAGCNHIEYHVTDGKSLEAAAEGSVDFIFSFDSLVHADGGVMDGYISQLARVLKPRGRAFLHHSNLGEYLRSAGAWRGRPRLGAVLKGAGWMFRDYHFRDPEVSAGLVRELAAKYKIRCATQEIICWRTRGLKIDCFSTFVNDWDGERRPAVIVRNGEFVDEARMLKRLSGLYLRG